MGNRDRVGARDDRSREGSGYKVSQVHGAQPFASNDPDSSRIWWSEVGVHQNLTFPVQPDPVSGMHCWHQRVHAREGRRRTTATATSSSTPTKSHEVYKEWLAMTRPAPGPDGLRRPLWFDRPLRPVPAGVQAVAQRPAVARLKPSDAATIRG